MPVEDVAVPMDRGSSDTHCFGIVVKFGSLPLLSCGLPELGVVREFVGHGGVVTSMWLVGRFLISTGSDGKVRRARRPLQAPPSIDP